MEPWQRWRRRRRRTALMREGSSTSPCIETVRECSAQATVEAALLLPSFLILLLLMIQPVCLLYTRAVMESAASSAARIMTTSGGDADEACRAFVLRRLQAVPNVSIFHEGGSLSWDIEFGHADDGGASRVKIRGTAKPLPILGAFVGAFAAGDAQGNVAIEVEVSYASRPEWLEGDYESWISSWGA